MRIRIVAAVALALSGAAGHAAPPPNPFNQRLLRMDDATRNGVMRRAVTDSGERCGRLERSVYTRRYANLEMWTARCIPGGTWGIYIGPDASVQVRDCTTLAGLKLPPCTILPPPAPSRRRR